MTLITAGMAVVLFLGCAAIAVAEWQLPRDSSRNAVITVLGLIAVVIGVRGLITDPLIGTFTLSVDLLVLLGLQIGIALTLLVGIRRGVQLIRLFSVPNR